MVPSTNTYSKSASADSSRKTFSKTSLSAQRRKRRNTEFHSPNSAGRSRHGAPVRAIQRTASRKSRLSLAVRPGSLSFPGSKRRYALPLRVAENTSRHMSTSVCCCWLGFGSSPHYSQRSRQMSTGPRQKYVVVFEMNTWRAWQFSVLLVHSAILRQAQDVVLSLSPRQEAWR